MVVRLWNQRGRALLLLGATLLSALIVLIGLVFATLTTGPGAAVATQDHTTRVLGEILALSGISALILAMSMVFPTLRSIMDVMAIIILLRSLAWTISPGLMALLNDGLVVNLFCFLIPGILLPKLIVSDWLDRMLPGDSLLREKRRILRAPATDVWAAISLAPHDSARHYDRTLLEVTQGPGGTVVEHFPSVPLLNGRRTTIVEQVPSRSQTLIRTPADATDGRAQEVAITLIPHGDRTEVVWREKITRPLIIERLCHWLDDDLGDDMHRLASWVEGRRDWSLYTAHFPHLDQPPGPRPPPLPA